MKRAINTYIEADWDKERDLGLTNISRYLVSDKQGADRYLCVRRIRIRTQAPSSRGAYLTVSFKDPLEGHGYEVARRLSNLGIFSTMSYVSILRTDDFFGLYDDGYQVTFGVPPPIPFTSGAMKVLRIVIDALGIDPKSAAVKCTQEIFVRVKNNRWLELGAYLKQRFLECPAAPQKASPASRT
jgi:hypothetical protein